MSTERIAILPIPITASATVSTNIITSSLDTLLKSIPFFSPATRPKAYVQAPITSRLSATYAALYTVNSYSTINADCATA